MSEAQSHAKSLSVAIHAVCFSCNPDFNVSDLDGDWAKEKDNRVSPESVCCWGSGGESCKRTLPFLGKKTLKSVIEGRGIGALAGRSSGELRGERRRPWGGL